MNKAAAPEVDSEQDDIFEEPEKKSSKKSGKRVNNGILGLR